MFFFLIWGERRRGERGEWWLGEEGKREEGRDQEEEEWRLGEGRREEEAFQVEEIRREERGGSRVGE